MAYNKDKKRDALKKLMTAVAKAYGGSIANANEWKPEEIDTLIDSALASMGDKDMTRSKTFRFPSELLDWLLGHAKDMKTSPNAFVVGLVQNEHDKHMASIAAKAGVTPTPKP